MAVNPDSDLTFRLQDDNSVEDCVRVRVVWDWIMDSLGTDDVMSAAEYSASVEQWLHQAYHWQLFALGKPINFYQWDCYEPMIRLTWMLRSLFCRLSELLGLSSVRSSSTKPGHRPFWTCVTIIHNTSWPVIFGSIRQSKDFSLVLGLPSNSASSNPVGVSPPNEPRHPVVGNSLVFHEFTIPPIWKRFIAELIDFLTLFVLKLFITYIAIDSLELFDVERFVSQNRRWEKLVCIWFVFISG